MKQAKRILSLLLVVTALVGLMTVGASAATDYQTLEAKALSAMGLFRGYDNSGNNFGLDNTLTREQALALLVRMKGEATAAEAWTGALPYSDVSAGNQLLPYIGYGKEKGYTVGIGNGKFGTGRTANMQEMTIFALRGLGYSDSKSVGDFDWNSLLPFAKNVGVLDSTKVIKPFTRGHAVDILMNTLASNIKGQNYDLLSKLMNDGVVSQAQYDKATEIMGSATQKYDLAAGTYTLKCLGNSLRVTSDKLELRNSSPAQTFTITNQDGYSYIQTADGYYVGVTKLTNGTQLVLGTTPYSWLIEKQSGSTYTIRPAEKPSMVVNACEEKSANGTKIIIWTHSGAPKNTLITFTAATKKIAVTGVKLDQTTATVAVGKSVQLTGTIAPANASNQNVTWSSSASSVAKVDSYGVVTGVKAGTATITAKTVDGSKTATCKVTVTADAKLTKSAVTLRNQTGKSITELYITDSSLSKYDGEFLTENGFNSFSHNKFFTSNFEFYADTKFDILLRFSDGTEAEALGLSFAKATTSACDLTLGAKEAILARNGVTLARVNFESKANDMIAQTNKAIDDYNAARIAYNTVVDAANKMGPSTEIVAQIDAMTNTIQSMTTKINAVTTSGKPFTAEQLKACNDVTASIKAFTKELQKLMDAAKPDMTVETNKAMGAYDTAVAAYNKVVDAANAQHLGENPDVRTIVNQVSATITAMSAKIDEHTNSNTPFTAEQVAQCNSVTADLKNFTAQLQTLVDTAKAAASKPADAKKTITIINNTAETFSLIQMAPSSSSYYEYQVGNSDLQQGESVTTTIDFTGVSLVWDMQILYPNKASIAFKGIDFTNCPATGTITLNSNGTAQFSW